MIKMTRIDRAKDMRRFHAMQVGVTLFGEVVLVKEWGRIGSPGRVREEIFASADLAQAALKKHQAVKMRRGYTVTRA
jgi:predicted DNA-binding WGR domain protein